MTHKKPSGLYIAGEDIGAGDVVGLYPEDGKLYRASIETVLVGNAAENIREGFRAEVKDGVVREDDA